MMTLYCVPAGAKLGNAIVNCLLLLEMLVNIKPVDPTCDLQELVSTEGLEKAG